MRQPREENVSSDIAPEQKEGSLEMKERAEFLDKNAEAEEKMAQEYAAKADQRKDPEKAQSLKRRLAAGIIGTWIAGSAALGGFGLGTQEAEAGHRRHGYSGYSQPYEQRGVEVTCTLLPRPSCQRREISGGVYEDPRYERERYEREKRHQQERVRQMEGHRWEQAKQNARREKDRWEQEVQRKEKTGNPVTVEMLDADTRHVLKIWGMWQGDYECKQYPPNQREVVVSRFYQPDFAQGFIEQCRKIIQSRATQQQGGQGPRPEFQERQEPPPWQR